MYNVIFKHQNPLKVTLYRFVYIVYWKGLGWWCIRTRFLWLHRLDWAMFPSALAPLKLRHFAWFLQVHDLKRKHILCYQESSLELCLWGLGPFWYVSVLSFSCSTASFIFIKILYGVSWKLLTIWYHIITITCPVCKVSSWRTIWIITSCSSGSVSWYTLGVVLFSIC